MPYLYIFNNKGPFQPFSPSMMVATPEPPAVETANSSAPWFYLKSE